MAIEFESYRGEMVAFCYRMLGSVHDAEDLTQEILLRAWQARDRYDPARASVRTWLYRIATNACLTALTSRARRPLPSGLGAPGEDPASTPLTPSARIPWLEPFPDARFDVERRADLHLAWVAAVQYLSARQRAVLVLREVLEFPAAEVARQLGTTVPAVNSALQRARLAMRSVAEPGALREPGDADQRAVIDRYARAFEAADVPALVRLLTEDAVLEMPPVPLWFRGAEHYGLFMQRTFRMRGAGWITRPLTANGQPALACYSAQEAGAVSADGVLAPDAGYQAHSLQVFALDADRIAANVVFVDPGLFAVFGLPEFLSASSR